VKKVQSFQNWLGATWLDAVRFALEKVLEIDPGNLTIQWASPQAMEDAEFWLSVQAQQDAGVPISYSLKAAGIPEALVSEWEKTRKEESEALALLRGRGTSGAAEKAIAIKNEKRSQKRLTDGREVSTNNDERAGAPSE